MRSATTLLAIISSIWQTLTKSHGQKPCLTGEPDASKGCTSGSGRGGQERTCKGNALAAYFTLIISACIVLIAVYLLGKVKAGKSHEKQTTA
jgi:hypothetical protein